MADRTDLRDREGLGGKIAGNDENGKCMKVVRQEAGLPEPESYWAK